MNRLNQENQTLTITGSQYSAEIALKGAELRSLRRLSDGKELIWQRDPAIWEDSCPMLFPICGRLNGGKYLFEGREHHMTIHGFLPSLMPYETRCEGSHAELLFCDDETTYEAYPFHFRLTMTYDVTETGVRCDFAIENRDDKTMYYSAGGHPGINLPLREGATLEDHVVTFPYAGDVHTVTIDNDGMFTGELPPRTLPDNTVTLSEEQFAVDGIFLNNVGSVMELRCKGTDTYVKVTCEAMDVAGLWKEYGAHAKFLCMEPWCGYPSIAGETDRLETKFGMHTLEAGKSGSFGFAIELLGE